MDFFSTPRTMVSVPRTPTAALPLRTASRAYSTWNKWPSGEKTVIALSYLAILRLRLLLLQLNSTDLISSLSLCLFLKTILRKLSHCVFFNYRSQLKPQGNPHTEELLCCVSHWRPGKIGPHSITRPNPKEKYGYMLHGLTRFLK